MGVKRKIVILMPANVQKVKPIDHLYTTKKVQKVVDVAKQIERLIPVSKGLLKNNAKKPPKIVFCY